MLFAIGFPRFAHGAEGMLYGLEFELMDMAMSTTGLVFVVLGIVANWWQKGPAHDGHGEPDRHRDRRHGAFPWVNTSARSASGSSDVRSDGLRLLLLVLPPDAYRLVHRLGHQVGRRSLCGCLRGSVVTASDLIVAIWLRSHPTYQHLRAHHLVYTIVLAPSRPRRTPTKEISSNPLVAD
ncbi:MAG: hypothetical protein CM15mP128_1950 [Methanobacteriota archaeon]|nr:MAG: hypothetical protein CM15mP128_1950 [Euryarchaeota archaeon]